MKEIMTDVVMLIVIATAIILGAWGLKSLCDSEEISDKALNEVFMIVDKYKMIQNLINAQNTCLIKI